MAFHRCAIHDESGTVMARDVAVSIEETTRAGAPSWYATITATDVAGLTAGQRYRIILDDGRTGEFRVRRNTVAGESGRAVAIDGTGPLA